MDVDSAEWIAGRQFSCRGRNVGLGCRDYNLGSWLAGMLG